MCGTFVVPVKALTAGTGSAMRFFCSEKMPSTHGAADEAQRDDPRPRCAREIVEVGRRLYARGYTASNDGNISVRLDDRRLLMTPKSVCKGFMDAGDDGASPISTARSSPASAIPRPRCRCTSRSTGSGRTSQAVVHAHPPIATGFAVAGIPLDRAVLAEVVTTLGSVPIAEYATPSTKELPEAVRKYVKAHDGMLLANHGALTLGADLFAAYYKMETIEHFANISLVARLLGGERLLSRQEVDAAAGAARHVRDRRRRRRSVRPGRGARRSGRAARPCWRPSSDRTRLVADRRRPARSMDGDDEIRLTYRELTALIEAAVRELKWP